MKYKFVLIIIIIFIFCIFSVAQADEAKQQEMKFDARVVLSSLITITENQIKAIESELELAALTEEAVSCDWKRIRPLLALIQYKQEREAIAWFALADGSYYTVDTGLMDKKLNDRPYFPRVLAGQVSIGELVVSKSAHQSSTIIAVPVKKGGSVAGMLGVSLFTKKLSQQIKDEMVLSDEVIFYALNKDHITVINAKPERVFLDPEAQGDLSMTKAIKEMLKKDEGIVEYDFHGKRRLVFKKSVYTGWWFALGLPVKETD